MSDFDLLERTPQCSFYSLYLIKASGIIQFNWYANNELKEKWKEDEILFSGFLIAINAIGQIFFEGKSIHSINFEENKIIFRTICPSNDLLCLVCSNACLEEDLDRFLQDTIDIVMKYPTDLQFANSNWNEKFSIEFDDLITRYKEKFRIGFVRPVKSPEEVKITNNDETKNINVQKPILNHPLNRDKILDLGKGLGNAFNNVLSIILGNINLAKMDAKPDSEQMECLNDAETSLSRAKVLSSLLLSISNKISSFKSQLDENTKI